ncbi:MAG: glycosyltransferase family 2 protein [Candidatus Roizmanbacteria bacterium]
MTDIELSIIIISYNTAKITQNCIQSIFASLKNTQLSYEIVVIDNASSDASVEMLKSLEKNHRQIKLTINTQNTGFGKANNQGALLAKGTHILLLNSDTLIIHSAIEDLLIYYKNNAKNIHFLGGKLLNTDKTPQPSCGPFYTLPIIFGALFLRGDYWGLTRYSPNTPRKVDWVSGACILTTKDHFTNVGGFDEKIFMYMEEIDLLFRANKQNLHTWIYPQAQFIHLGSASSNGRKEPIIQVYKGFIFFYKKHYGPIPFFFLRIMLQLKAVGAWILGKLLHNTYLIQTYGEALKIATMA